MAGILYRTAVSIWFASQALKPKLPVERHIQSHFKISIYSISNWLSIKTKNLVKTIINETRNNW